MAVSVTASTRNGATICRRLRPRLAQATSRARSVDRAADRLAKLIAAMSRMRRATRDRVNIVVRLAGGFIAPIGAPSKWMSLTE